LTVYAPAALLAKSITPVEGSIESPEGVDEKTGLFAGPPLVIVTPIVAVAAWQNMPPVMVAVGAGLIVIVNGVAVLPQLFAFDTEIVPLYVPAAIPAGTARLTGLEAGNVTSIESLNPAVCAAASKSMVNLVGEFVVAVNGKVAVVEPWQMAGLAPRVIVGRGYTVTSTLAMPPGHPPTIVWIV
jgi:hypothetical protein